MELAIAASAATSKRLLENVVDDLYEYIKSECGDQLVAWRAGRRIDSLYKKLRHIRFVKTIWQAEKEIDLARFYYQSRLFVDGQRRVVKELSDIGYDGNILIQGTVGQGKSIFMRYLVSTELNNGNILPIFVQLMRVGAEQSLVSHLLGELKALGLPMDLKVFEKVIGTGKVRLFLDAFDEIDEDHQQRLLSEIETLARTYEALQIVVTSRPERAIAFSPFFRVYELAPLVGKEYEAVIRRMAANDKTAERIISGVRASENSVAQLLTTPLMVALLMVRFKIEQSIPENEIAFYDGLFLLLLQRHDKSKGGYARPRKSKLGDFRIQDAFNALCFLTRKARRDPHVRDLQTTASEAVALVAAATRGEDLVADIVEITCLVIIEGDEWRFVHKTVQEYHAALFVARQPDVAAIEFYKAMLTRWKGWPQELRFLESLDRYRYQKHFAIPMLRAALGLQGDQRADDAVINDEAILAALGPDEIGVDVVDPDDGAPAEPRVHLWGHVRSGEFWPIARHFHVAKPESFPVNKLMNKPRGEVLAGVPAKDRYTFAEIAAHQGRNGPFMSAAHEYFDDLKQELQALNTEVEEVEGNRRLFEFELATK